jgi:hypothetical protein
MKQSPENSEAHGPGTAGQDEEVKPQTSRSDLLMDFAKEHCERVKNPVHSWEIDALLYDEDGLPK